MANHCRWLIITSEVKFGLFFQIYGNTVIVFKGKRKKGWLKSWFGDKELQQQQTKNIQNGPTEMSNLTFNLLVVSSGWVCKLAQKSFVSPGKKCSTSKTEDTKIILFAWPYALEGVSINMIPNLRKVNVKWQSSGYLTDSGSHQKSCTKILSIQIVGESLMQHTVALN